MSTHSESNAAAHLRSASTVLSTLMPLVVSLSILDSPALAAGNPVPLITSISPLSVMPGHGYFTLTVRGTGFVNGVPRIYWNGAAVAATSRDFNGDRALDLAVADGADNSHLTVMDGAVGSLRLHRRRGLWRPGLSSQISPASQCRSSRPTPNRASVF